MKPPQSNPEGLSDSRDAIDTFVGPNVDPVDTLRNRNQRAVDFLTSIKTSNTPADIGLWDSHSIVRTDNDTCESKNVVSDTCAEQPNKEEAEILAVSPGSRDEAAPQHAAEAAESHGEVSAGYGYHARQPLEPPTTRRLSHALVEVAEQSGKIQELAAAKPTSRSMGFKPFIGKNEERTFWHGTGVANSNIRAEAENEAEDSSRDMYKAGVLDDPGQQKGLQRAMAGLTEYMGTIFDNVRPDDQRQEGHLEVVLGGPTLEQIRRLRAHMLRVTREQDLELSTAAIGWVYFEKLIFKGYAVKDNRKLVAAVCLLLALKINESREVSISRSLQAIQRRFEVSTSLILDQEFSVFAELDFSLWIPCREFMPHFVRMFEAMGKLRLSIAIHILRKTNIYMAKYVVIGAHRTMAEYLGTSEFFARNRKDLLN
ncbi:hypothetical protein IWW42_005303 [Coemansia sp. RSA 1085]|nr:hypothetical protein LPJ68_004565 [Coemansia sp. RSA 1086]KAJ2668285.1 hypothetical protein IWW42_005303 [Coemansia sp. RSA 1085]